MLPTMASMDEWQQRAVDNERLRRLAVSELESTRDQLADTGNQLQRTRADLVKTNDLLVAALQQSEAALGKNSELEASLAESQDVVARQKAYIERLRTQVGRPLRTAARQTIRKIQGGR